MVGEVVAVEPAEEVALTPPEREELARHEAVIERGMQTFLEVGRALYAIKTGKLYRETHFAWEHYLQEKWSLGYDYAYRLIEAAEVVENVAPLGIGLPENEAQARALATAGNAKDQQTAWALTKERANGQRITAKIISEVAAEVAAPRREAESQKREADRQKRYEKQRRETEAILGPRNERDEEYRQDQHQKLVEHNDRINKRLGELTTVLEAELYEAQIAAGRYTIGQDHEEDEYEFQAESIEEAEQLVLKCVRGAYGSKEKYGLRNEIERDNVGGFWVEHLHYFADQLLELEAGTG